MNKTRILNLLSACHFGLLIFFVGSFLFCLQSHIAIASQNKAIVISASQSENGQANHSQWLENGTDNVCRALQDHPEFELKIITDPKSEKVGEIEASLLAKPKNAAKYETLIVYLTGYIVPATSGDKGNLRFAFSDFDPGNPEEGSISLTELCAIIAKTPATNRLLVLDTFAFDGSNTGNRVASDTFKNCGAIYMMASCENGFCGRFWEEQKMSLFAFWFAEAIQGSADRSLDGKVSMSELDSYMTMSVGNLSKAMGSPQKLFAWQLKTSGTPIPFATKNSPTIISPVPEDKVASVNRIASQMQAIIPHYGMNRVAVPEFTMAQGNKMTVAKPLLDDQPALMAKDMEGRLISKLTTDRCVVLPTNRLQEIMQLEKIEPESLLSEKSKAVLTKTMVEGKPLSSIIVGFFKTANSLSYTCGLVDVATMKPLLVTSSIVAAPQRELNGDSGFNPEYPVAVQVKNKTGEFESRKIHFINDRAYVALQKEDIYQVVLWNLTDDTVGFRLLVDGMNTLPEKASTIIPGQELPTTFSTMKSRNGEYISQKQIPLSEANFWILPPSPKREDGKLSNGAKVKGFYKTMGQNTTYREFVVTDATESKAYRAGYTNELGMITVGIYSLREKPVRGPDKDLGVDGLGTKEGEELVDKEIKGVKGMEIVETKSLIYIRYVSPENLQLLLKNAQNQ